MMVNGPGIKVLRCMLALAICVWPGLNLGSGGGARSGEGHY